MLFYSFRNVALDAISGPGCIMLWLPDEFERRLNRNSGITGTKIFVIVERQLPSIGLL